MHSEQTDTTEHYEELQCSTSMLMMTGNGAKEYGEMHTERIECLYRDRKIERTTGNNSFNRNYCLFFFRMILFFLDAFRRRVLSVVLL